MPPKGPLHPPKGHVCILPAALFILPRAPLRFLTRLNSMQGQLSKCTREPLLMKIALSVHESDVLFRELQAGGGSAFLISFVSSFF